MRFGNAYSTDLPLDHTSANRIFQVVSRRYERGSIVLTSNRGFADWGQVYADHESYSDLPRARMTTTCGILRDDAGSP